MWCGGQLLDGCQETSSRFPVQQQVLYGALSWRRAVCVGLACLSGWNMTLGQRGSRQHCCERPYELSTLHKQLF